MIRFPAIEQYRAELRAMDYAPLTDRELADVTRRHRNARHSSAIEGIEPMGEQVAFDELLLEERVPNDVAEQLTHRFVRERLLSSAVARAS